MYFVDVALFLLFFLVVLGVSLYKSRKEETGEYFFLASRGQLWPFIGMLLIAANISTEHFVGMAGQAFGIGRNGNTDTESYRPWSIINFFR